LGGLGGLSKKTGGDECDVMAPSAELTPDPEEGEHIASGTEWKKGDFQWEEKI
jgi:hypothetical protein